MRQRAYHPQHASSLCQRIIPMRSHLYSALESSHQMSDFIVSSPSPTSLLNYLTAWIRNVSHFHGYNLHRIHPHSTSDYSQTIKHARRSTFYPYARSAVLLDLCLLCLISCCIYGCYVQHSDGTRLVRQDRILCVKRLS